MVKRKPITAHPAKELDVYKAHIEEALDSLEKKWTELDNEERKAIVAMVKESTDKVLNDDERHFDVFYTIDDDKKVQLLVQKRA